MYILFMLQTLSVNPQILFLIKGFFIRRNNALETTILAMSLENQFFAARIIQFLFISRF